MADIASPCTKVCTVEPRSGLCRGCGRSLDEIERWAAMTNDERARIVHEAPRRLAALAKARSARSENG